MSIKNDIVHFPISDNSENEAEGPVLPIPGPLLPRAEIQLNILSSRLLPLMINNKTPSTYNNINIIKKLTTLLVLSSSITSLDTFTLNKALG
jgi:hypothetical protein